MSGLLVDSTAWIDFFAGETLPLLEPALEAAAVWLTPIVVAELVSGAHRERDRRAIEELIMDLPIHPTPLPHWIRVGKLRRELREAGFSISTPDAHVAQCALELNAVLLSRDTIFSTVAGRIGLQVASW